MHSDQLPSAGCGAGPVVELLSLPSVAPPLELPVPPSLVPSLDPRRNHPPRRGAGPARRG